MFSFQANEHSVCIHVALQHCMRNQADLRVVPFLSLELPLKKKGPSYQTNFVVTR